MILDFSKATVVENGYLLIPEPDNALLEFKPVYDRISAIIYHASMVGDKPVKSNISIDTKDITHIRAAFCEFVGIEDLIKQTYPKIDTPEYRIYKTKNPVFHMIKLLRNYNIHILNSRINKKTWA